MITNSWVRITAWAAGLVAVAAGLHIIQLLYQPVIGPVLGVLTPIFIALVLALLLDPTIDKLENRGLSRSISVALVACLFFAAVVLLAVVLVPILINQARELAENLPGYWKQLEAQISEMMSSNEGLLKRFHLPTTIGGLSDRYSDQIQAAAGNAFSGFAGFLAGFISKVIWIVIIPIVTIFFIIDIDRIKVKALLIMPEVHRKRTAALASSVGIVFGSYVRGLITVAFLYGFVCGVAMALMGVPYAVILGAAAGVLSLVPYIGTITTVLLVLIVAYVTSSGNTMYAVWGALLIVALNQVFDNIISPKVVGKAVGIHPALAIIALLIGARLFGLGGMILAVPVAASMQIVVLEFCPALKEAKKAKKKPKRSFLGWLKQQQKK